MHARHGETRKQTPQQPYGQHREKWHGSPGGKEKSIFWCDMIFL